MGIFSKSDNSQEELVKSLQSQLAESNSKLKAALDKINSLEAKVTQLSQATPASSKPAAAPVVAPQQTMSADATVLKPAKPQKIKSGEFKNSTFTEVIIPDTVVEISSRAFINCKNLKKIQLPARLVKIGEAVFRGCESLESIVIPDNVTSIEWECFYNCTSLKKIILPKGLKRICGTSFKGCSLLELIEIPEGVTTITDAWTTGGDTRFGAFEECVNLTSVKLPSTLLNIGSLAFFNCISLTSIEIPNSVTKIGGGAFSSCKSLTSITLPKRFEGEISDLSIPDGAKIKYI